MHIPTLRHFTLLCPSARESQQTTMCFFSNSCCNHEPELKHTKVPLPIKGWNCQRVTFISVDWWESTLQTMLKWITASRLPPSHTRDYPVTYELIVRKREKMHPRKDSKHKGGCQNLKQACSLSLLPSWNLFNVQQLLGRNRHAGARVEKQNFTTARLALATWLDRLVI